VASLAYHAALSLALHWGSAFTTEGQRNLCSWLFRDMDPMPDTDEEEGVSLNASGRSEPEVIIDEEEEEEEDVMDVDDPPAAVSPIRNNGWSLSEAWSNGDSDHEEESDVHILAL
jgi:hypothetical protein